MNELGEIKDIISKNHLEVKERLAKIDTHFGYTREEINEHKKVLEDYKRHKNVVYGAIISLSTIFGFLASWLKEHIFK